MSRSWRISTLRHRTIHKPTESKNSQCRSSCRALHLILRDAIESALDTPQKQQKFAADTKVKPIKRVYAEVQNRLDPVMERISAGLNKEDIGAELSGVFDLIRKTRNDAGHPTGRIMEREEAFALLQLFPSYCKVSHDVIDWLKTEKI